jgi:2-amino-5-formylamino-6-ribosylaminopyrimidin-4(3H)-one 5'-monophosphate deformylase
MSRNQVGVIILGSQDEKHGLLPKDIDTKLATYVALYAGALTDAKLVGIVNSAAEFEYIRHGRHHHLSAEFEYIRHGRHHHLSAVLYDLKRIIENAVQRLMIKRFVVVNGHGGNTLIVNHLPELEKSLGVTIIFNNIILELEGAHAGQQECSMASAAGLVDNSKLDGQEDFQRFPEVGFVGMVEAHQNKKIKMQAEKTVKEGVKVDLKLGKKLLGKAIEDVVTQIKSL